MQLGTIFAIILSNLAFINRLLRASNWIVLRLDLHICQVYAIPSAMIAVYRQRSTFNIFKRKWVKFSTRAVISIGCPVQ